MKAIAQALTYKELYAISSALGIILRQYEKLLPLESKPMITAFEKICRAIEDTYSQHQHDVYFLIIPVAIEEIEKEQ